MACTACSKEDGREAWPAVSNSCATGCSGNCVTSCISRGAQGRSSGVSGELEPSSCHIASVSVCTVTPSLAMRQVSSGLRSWRSISLRCSAADTGWSRAHSLMPCRSKMSRLAMMRFVWLASRMVASACGLAVPKAAAFGATGTGAFTAGSRTRGRRR